MIINIRKYHFLRILPKQIDQSFSCHFKSVRISSKITQSSNILFNTLIYLECNQCILRVLYELHIEIINKKINRASIMKINLLLVFFSKEQHVCKITDNHSNEQNITIITSFSVASFAFSFALPPSVPVSLWGDFGSPPSSTVSSLIFSLFVLCWVVN